MDAPPKSLLIIFYRNPILGKVKTRLAATLGKERALEIYQRLTYHTRSITEGLAIDKIVFYSDSIDLMDVWPNATYLKTLQNGADLGQKMNNAFVSAFESGYNAVCIIGTDCYELTSSIIEQAFERLLSADAVIGPALDGGYYLLGMRKIHDRLFRNKQWSSGSVFSDTIQDFNLLGLRYSRLEVLRDVDTEGDLPDGLSNL